MDYGVIFVKGRQQRWFKMNIKNNKLEFIIQLRNNIRKEWRKWTVVTVMVEVITMGDYIYNLKRIRWPWCCRNELRWNKVDSESEQQWLYSLFAIHYFYIYLSIDWKTKLLQHTWYLFWEFQSGGFFMLFFWSEIHSMIGEEIWLNERTGKSCWIYMPFSQKNCKMEV